MSEATRVPLKSFIHKLPTHENGLYICPACKQPALFINWSNEQDVTFTCANDCSRFQIFDALGVPPDAIVYNGDTQTEATVETSTEATNEDRGVRRVPLGSFGYKLTKHASGLYICPVCNKPTLSVDLSNEQDVALSCTTEDCFRFKILAALGYPANIVIYVGNGSAEGTQDNASTQEPMTQETALQWLTMFNVTTFPDFVWIIKKENKGHIPVTHQGANVDAIAAAFGYKITADRKYYYKPPTLSNAADLLDKDIAPPQFAVDGLLPAGLCLFSAPSKIGKSWLVLDLCNAVANGLPFMGRKVNQGDAFYLDLEGSEYGLQDRMRKMGCKRSKALHYAFTVPNVGGGMTDFLSDWCASVPAPRLIVIDVLQRAKPLGKANRTAYEQDYELYAPLNAFALEKGIAILAVTHNRKSNGLTTDDYESISGSVGQMGAAQTAWIITGKRGQAEEKTFKATGRDIREVEDLILFNLATWRWENKGNAEEAANEIARNNYAASPIRKTLIELLDADGSGSWYGTYADLFEEIAERTGEYPYESANALAKGIRSMMLLLAQNDGILHIKDKHKSGYHKFFRQKLRGV